ncbi:conserved hypothetical protein [Histoplasma mississippiense (nom. inval.)]|uniref:conserved hypothetical protein n=1 Tax=Ajellomyces capsulatus (strain NAm1 / WU24) TaxID=2059318 RepID=UPI000157CB21|nr:conserved hypothetical protein [Histoplasma mississippiense (nom. inval.)]EDN09348.1 conserved hypothetical protein [Histoplasma mississippiense (nom. inval.)]
MFHTSSSTENHNEICTQGGRRVESAKIKEAEIVEANVDGYMLKKIFQNWGWVLWKRWGYVFGILLAALQFLPRYGFQGWRTGLSGGPRTTSQRRYRYIGKGDKRPNEITSASTALDAS